MELSYIMRRINTIVDQMTAYNYEIKFILSELDKTDLKDCDNVELEEAIEKLNKIQKEFDLME